VQDSKQPHPQWNLSWNYRGCLLALPTLWWYSFGRLADPSKITTRMFRKLEQSCSASKFSTSNSTREVGISKQCEFRANARRYQVLYILASSVLQLADTAWLPSSWTLDDIYYRASSTREPSELRILRGFANPASLPGITAQSVNNPLVTNATIFCLGIALIEISYCQPLNELRQPVDLDINGHETSFTDSLTATRLLPDIVHREGERYAEIVRKCIMGSFSSIKPKLSNNSAFQEQFYLGVIQPLLQIHNVLK
jgi:hypothetical protein